MADPVVEKPTYFQHVRFFFDPVDIDHMREVGLDLSTYEGVKERAESIYFRTRPPDATMPPEPARRWSKERAQTFSNWVRQGCPLGEPTPQPVTSPATGRIRKDAAVLSAGEIDQLSNAFRGVMSREAADPGGYFALAGIHWFPAPNECLHHEDRYNPWHRAYLIRFEEALRSVPGCESVTMPYWDISQPPPSFLFDPPFDEYVLPQRIHDRYDAGYATRRHTAQEIALNVLAAGVTQIIENAMAQPVWSDFISYTSNGIEAAHDGGHPACGETMAVPDAAAFDPIFWFFHANWDRLWWQWQQKMGATTLATFRSTITGSTEFLEPPFNGLKPFALSADRAIDLSALGIGYTQAAAASEAVELRVDRARRGSFRLLDGPRVRIASQASVRLKGLNRLAIPGTFFAVLNADGEEVGRRTFFQSTAPVDCASCRERAVIDLDFITDLDQVLGRSLTATIELAVPSEAFGSSVPLSVCGDPSLNVRLLLERS